MKMMQLESRSSYLLMNKDIVVCKLSAEMDARPDCDTLPRGFYDLPSWVTERSKICCAKESEKFLMSLGLRSKDSIINATHCVSLRDSFWVKREGDTVNWAQVSPFRNNYSEVISRYALEGVDIKLRNGKYFSPTLGTTGSFPHTWKMTEEGVKFLKAGSRPTPGNNYPGREPYSEYYASVIGKALGFNCVDYKIRYHTRHDGEPIVITECDCFTTEDTGSVSAGELGLESYEDVIDYAKSLGEDSHKAIRDMFFLDCVLGNIDRHLGNIEFYVNNETQEVVGVAPIFDNNCSLAPYHNDSILEIPTSCFKTSAGTEFGELFDLVTRKRNYSRSISTLRSLVLKPPKGVSIDPARLRYINWFIQNQLDHLLGRCFL